MRPVYYKAAIIVNLIIIVSILLLCLIIIYKNLTVNDMPLDKRIEMIDIGSLKTGDILSVSYSDVRKMFSATLYSSIWTHVGLVYVDPKTKEVYVMEVANYRPPYSGNVVKIPILHWVRINLNSNAVGLTSINKEIENTKILEEKFEEFRNLNMGIEGLDSSWLRFYKKKTPNEVSQFSPFASKDRRSSVIASSLNNRSRPIIRAKRILSKILKPTGMSTDLEEDYRTYMLTCSEVLVSVLQEAGVYSTEYTACSFLPSEIVHAQVPTMHGYNYDSLKTVNIKWLASDSSRYL